jgi:hypothetical protein
MSDEILFDSNAFLKNLTSKPGVYRMYNIRDEVIYVGKAKNLKKRVSSYFRKTVDSVKTQSLVTHITKMDVTVVSSETEAFILENIVHVTTLYCVMINLILLFSSPTMNILVLVFIEALKSSKVPILVLILVFGL